MSLALQARWGKSDSESPIPNQKKHPEISGCWILGEWIAVTAAECRNDVVSQRLEPVAERPSTLLMRWFVLVGQRSQTQYDSPTW
jgi:hypothetical protein